MRFCVFVCLVGVWLSAVVSSFFLVLGVVGVGGL